MLVTMASTHRIGLATYIFTRLKQAGVSHVYGVPGDFTLKALDRLQSSGLHFVGCCNELNAGYAADGFARAQRWMGQGQLGALFTTYGVGELSAANAVAGCYAEHVPIVHLVGTPSLQARRRSASTTPNREPHLQIHHSLGDGRTTVFRDLAKSFTAAQLDLGAVAADDAHNEIDWVLAQAIRKSQPVYIGLPADAADVPIDGSVLAKPLRSDQAAGSNFHATKSTLELASELLQRLYSSRRPMILVDRAGGMDGMRNLINDFVTESGLPTLALPSGAGMINTSVPNYLGLHSGVIGEVDTTPFVQSSDLVLALGPQFSDTQTLGWGTVPKRENMVIMSANSIDGAVAETQEVFREVLVALNKDKLPKGTDTGLPDFRNTKPSTVNPTHLINQTEFYKRLIPHLTAHDTILLGNATPVIGGQDLILPEPAQLIASGMWFSIGHMLPAALGVAQAKAQATGMRSGRTILLDGDGSFQVTAQELSTIIRERLDCIIFILNNGGYTYERLIHGKHESYNEIADWDYLVAPRLFGGRTDVDGYAIGTHRAHTWGDLDQILKSEGFRNGHGLILVDVRVDRFDIPERAKVVFDKARNVL